VTREEETMCAIANRRWLRGLTLRFVALILVVFGVLGIPGATRAAADYSVVQCVPYSQGYTDAGLTSFGPYSIWGTNQCGSPNGLRLDTGARGPTGWTANGSGLAWRFTAPGGTSFVSASASLHYGDDGGLTAALFSNGTPAFQGFGACSTPTTCWVPAATIAGGTIFEVRMQCFAAINCHSDWAYVWTTNFTAVVRDGSAPGVSASGPLLADGWIHGVKDLKTSASDVGGGARSILVYVNGFLSRSADFCPPDYQGSYTHLKPCPGSDAQTFEIDTDKDPGWVDGANSVEICSVDAGGNRSCVHRTVAVDNTCPGSGGTSASSMNAGAEVHGKLTDRAAVRSSDQPVIRGALADRSGKPVADATVCVYETVDLPDASRQLVSKLTTQGNGHFATLLDPGPSRHLDLVYRYNDKLLADRVELDSRVVPTLKIPKNKRHIRNGKATRFKGSLPGPNAAGRVVALQAQAGRKWRTFKQLRTKANGRFHGKYRFLSTRGRQRYLFRVLVKKQAGYPYEPGHSHKRKVVVRG
jgi:hypothetical protein